MIQQIQVIILLKKIRRKREEEKRKEQEALQKHTEFLERQKKQIKNRIKFNESNSK